MPITLTYDIQGAPPTDHHRLLTMFERLGWERFGGTVYHYPRTDPDAKATEDWMNDVIPALMILRAYIIRAQEEGRDISGFTIDVQGFTGYSRESGDGIAAETGSAMPLCQSNRRDFGEVQLRELIDSFRWPSNY